MSTITKHIALIAIMLCACTALVTAQPGFYVPKNAKIFFKGDTATIFSDVHNQGKLGIGKQAVVNFKGKTWENDDAAMLTDDGETATGVGGTVRFNADSVPQQLNGGYNAATRQGAAFSTLEIHNSRGVELINSTAKVRNQLQLSSGLLYLKNNVLVVGDGNPGNISGYNAGRFIVTGDPLSGGVLVREGISSQHGLVTFPIGSSANAYTPAGIKSHAALPDDFFAAVADTMGTRLSSTRNLQQEGVGKIWQIGKRLRPNDDEVDVFLQHLVTDEGSMFAQNRSHAYIAQHTGNNWDESLSQLLPQAGYLTSGSPLLEGAVNSRTFSGRISGSAWFTKLTGYGDTTSLKTKLWFNAYRLDNNKVRTYWTTRPEVDVKYFVVQRRLSNEAIFSNIDTIASKANGTISRNLLSYESKNANKYTGVSFYRLLLKGYGTDSSYSNIVAVGGSAGRFELLLWPNPTPDVFYVGLNGEVDVKAIVLFDLAGQKLREIMVNGRSVISMSGLIPGTYMVAFISSSGRIMETKRLLVVGY